MIRPHLLLALTLLASTACGDDTGPTDGGAPADASRPDASSEPIDAGIDAGARLDGALLDAAGPSDAGTDGGSSSSGGSGGLTCDRMGDLGGGRSYCQVRLGSVDVRFLTPTGGSGPFRLAVYLHGDGAGAYNSGSVLRVLAPWADAHHAIVAAVLAPNGCAWWQTPAHDCDSAIDERDDEHQNADALVMALEGLRAAYDVENARVFYYGSSGGSNFLTGSFFPRFGDRYPGILAVNCGGEAPWDETFTWDPDADRGSQLFFTYGDADFLREEAHETYLHYQDLGFTVSETVLGPGVEHCAFDGHGRAAEVWSAAIGE